MSYNTNPALVEARMGLLLELVAGRACRWHTSPDRESTKRLEYKIHESLYIASLYPERFPELAAARRRFSISVVSPGVIEAKPRETGEAFATPIHGTAVAGKPVPTVGVTTAQGVIDSWLMHMPSQDAINFQQSTLPPEELKKLYTWAIEHQPKLMLLVGERTLTLSLFDADVAEYAWHPEQKPVEPEVPKGI